MRQVVFTMDADVERRLNPANDDSIERGFDRKLSNLNRAIKSSGRALNRAGKKIPRGVVRDS